MFLITVYWLRYPQIFLNFILLLHFEFHTKLFNVLDANFHQTALFGRLLTMHAYKPNLWHVIVIQNLCVFLNCNNRFVNRGICDIIMHVVM